MGREPSSPSPDPSAGAPEFWAQIVRYSQNLVAAPELPSVQRQHLRNIRTLIEADAYGINVLDHGSLQPVAVDARGVSDDFLTAYVELGRRRDLVARDLFFQYILAKRRPVHDGLLFPDGDWKDQVPACTHLLAEHGLKHAMLVPLVRHGALVGTLHFCRSSAQGPFTQTELRIAGLIMGVTASAVGNALSYARLDDRCAAAEAMVRRNRTAVLVCDRYAQILVESDKAAHRRASWSRAERRLFLSALRVNVEEAAAVGKATSRPWEATEVGTSRLPGSRGLFVTQIRETVARRSDFSGLVPPLTAREAEVLECTAHGLRDHETARALHVTPHTVRQHLKSIYRKLDARNRADAVRLALEGSGATPDHPVADSPTSNASPSPR